MAGGRRRSSMKDDEDVMPDAFKPPPRISIDYNAEDPNLSWLYQPHTFMLLLLGVILLVVYGRHSGEVAPGEVETAAGQIASTQNGIIGCICVFLLFSMLQMRDGIFRRPHPAFWRVVMGAAVVYLMFLIYIYFQSVHEARQFLKFWDPELGKPLPEKSYAENCEFTYDNVMGTVRDEFVLAHFIGWWGKALVFRDARITILLSVIFEFMELTFRHVLPNFKECWWDHILLDILLCNGFGIYLGNLTAKWLEVKEYDWTGMPKSKRVMLRALVQFTPQYYQPFSWKIFSTPKRLYYIAFLVILTETVELNVFFLKYVLWVPPSHWMIVARLFLCWLVAFPAMREFYEYIDNPHCKRIGTMVWLGCATVGVESLIVIKFGMATNLFDKSFPFEVKVGWGLACLLALSAGLFFFYLKKNRGSPTGEGDDSLTVSAATRSRMTSRSPTRSNSPRKRKSRSRMLERLNMDY